MKTEEFQTRKAKIAERKTQNDAKLQQFEQKMSEKLKALFDLREEVVAQLRECYRPADGEQVAECSDGGISYIVRYDPADLRDKQNRDKITITVRDRSSGVERGNSAETDMLVRMVDTGVIDTINDAHGVAEIVGKIQNFVTLADGAVKHFLNHEENDAIQQSNFLEQVINPDDDEEGYW